VCARASERTRDASRAKTTLEATWCAADDDADADDADDDPTHRRRYPQGCGARGVVVGHPASLAPRV
jgi:hypothetical protein